MENVSRRLFLAASAGGVAAATTGCAPSENSPAPTKASVTYEFVRNATARLSYAGLTILLDPMLSPKGALQSFAGIAPNPTVDLPRPVDEIIADIDAVIVSHLHSDHFDEAASEALAKDVPMLTPANTHIPDFSAPEKRETFEQSLRAMGFTNVTSLSEDGPTEFGALRVHQVWGLHGRGEVGQLLGNVNGMVLEAEGAPTIFWAGDSILDEAETGAILDRFKPDIVIAHTGGPIIEALSPEILLMDAAQAVRMMELASAANPEARMVAVHMESLDHCFSTRADLREALASIDPAMSGRVFIPADGDSLTL